MNIQNKPQIKKVIVYTFVLVFSLSVIGLAAPSITSGPNIITDGDDVIIFGSNFGTNNTPAPILEDDFESGTDGEYLQTENWLADGDENGGIFSTSNPRTGAQSAQWHFTKQDTGESEYYHKYQEINGQKKLYATFWQYIEGLYNRGMKSLRLSHGDPYSGIPQIAIRSYLKYENEGAFSGVARDFNDDHAADYVGEAMLPHDQWNRIEVFFDLGDANQANGEIKFANVGHSNERVGNLSLANEESQLLDTVFIGQGIPGGEDYTNGYVYLDDLYVAPTQARVEIGDNATFANCNHREIQQVSAWASDEITITADKGTFSNGATAYLFVVDENGDASSGYEITISGAAATIGTGTGSLGIGSGSGSLTVGE